MAKKFFIKTFGCQMNVYDSHRIALILQDCGYAETSKQQDADLVIFNTCHIREKAAEKVFSDLGRAMLIKQSRAASGLDTIIGVTGCVVQAEDEQIGKRAPYVDFALGPLTYCRLPQVLGQIQRCRAACEPVLAEADAGKSSASVVSPDRLVAKESSCQCIQAEGQLLAESAKEAYPARKNKVAEKFMPLIDTDFPAESKFDYLPPNRSEGGCSFLAVQEGCNNFCTYCVVPYTRGAEYSRPVKEVLEEARQLIATGTLEINLLGQNVNSYHGEDESGKERDLAYLLQRMAELDGLERLRYTTSYPADVNDALIACHRDLPKLMPYLHLPVQSGSDRILKSMNRRHNRGEYLEIVAKLKEANAQLRLSSDFIVGFPGETDEDFEQTLSLVNEVKYIQAFSFKYSRRAGTPAAVMPGQVEEKVKKERLNILQNLLFDYQAQFNKACVGQVFPVLFEQKGRHKGQLIGRTPYMQNLHASLNEKYLNKIVNVRVEDATTNSLSGKVL